MSSAGRLLRILHAYKVYRPDVLGGGVEAITTVAAGLRARHDTRILVCRLKGRGRAYTEDGVAVEAVGSAGTLLSMPLSPTYPFVFAKRIRDVDLVAMHQPFPLNDVGLALASSPKTAVVLHWHAEIFGRRALMPLVAPLLKRTLQRADRVIVSDGSMIGNSPFLSQVADKCVVIPFGIDADQWAGLTDAEQAKVAALRSAHPRLIVGTGRLVSYKGFGVLIEAMRTIDGTAVIVGEGILEDRLRGQAESLGVADRVILAGRLSQSDLKVHLHAAKVFAFPSTNIAETFGIAQLEAMATGLPIVNTNLPTGVPHVARHDREALTVPPNDAAALASAISCILDDDALRVRLGQAAAQRIQETHRIPDFITRVEATYRDAVAARGMNSDVTGSISP